MRRDHKQRLKIRIPRRELLLYDAVKAKPAARRRAEVIGTVGVAISLRYVRFGRSQSALMPAENSRLAGGTTASGTALNTPFRSFVTTKSRAAAASR
jgi:hypothetical protein